MKEPLKTTGSIICPKYSASAFSLPMLGVVLYIIFIIIFSPEFHGTFLAELRGLFAGAMQ